MKQKSAVIFKSLDTMHVLQTKTKSNQLPFFFLFGQVPRVHAEQTVLRVTWDLKESKVRQVCLDSAAYPVFRTVFRPFWKLPRVLPWWNWYFASLLHLLSHYPCEIWDEVSGNRRVTSHIIGFNSLISDYSNGEKMMNFYAAKNTNR